MLNTLILIYLVLIVKDLNFISAQLRVTEDKYDPVSDMIEMAGYPSEIHEVVTKDGYILRMHRIPSGDPLKIILTPDGINPLQRIGDSIKNIIENRNRQPVLIMHGLFCSSADWVVGGPEKGLGYILADAGFDVWMGNSRGNTFSRKHAYMDPNEEGFWKFSWHEIGIYDLPAMINYILRKTNRTSLHYVGHSQGTTILFVLTSLRPHYNSKIISASAMAPIAYLHHMQQPILRGLANFVDQLTDLLDSFGMYELSPNSPLTRTVTGILCNDISIAQELCAAALFSAVGFDSDQLNRTLLPTIFEYIPAGISWKQFIHFGQLIKSHKFQMFDHNDKVANVKAYGTFTPPEYMLSLIRVPIALYYGDKDYLLSTLDAEHTGRELKNVISKNVIYGFNHVDFLFATDAHKMVYNRIIKMMRETQEQLENSSSNESS